MSAEQTNRWNVPIWKLTTRGGFVYRILRVSEAMALMDNIDSKDQGIFRKIEISNKDAKTFLEAILFSGMRLSELIILKKHPLDKDGKPHFRGDRIWLPREKFGTGDKGKFTQKDRFVYLSDTGRKIMSEFMEHTELPVISYQKDNELRVLTEVFSSMLKASADRIGLQKRPFMRTVKKAKRNPEGKPVLIDGKPWYEKINIEQRTTGVSLRALRATSEAWLLISYIYDPFKIQEIAGSFGQTPNVDNVLYKHGALGFDDEDMEDIKKATAGYGSTEIKRPDE